MGHLIFTAMHLSALLFVGVLALVITVPLHLIYAAVRRPKDATEKEGDTLVRCQKCRELVRWDATRCKHCSAEITPLAKSPRDAKPWWNRSV